MILVKHKEKKVKVLEYSIHKNSVDIKKYDMGGVTKLPLPIVKNSPEEAQAEMDKLVAARKAAGYTEVTKDQFANLRDLYRHLGSFQMTRILAARDTEHGYMVQEDMKQTQEYDPYGNIYVEIANNARNKNCFIIKGDNIYELTEARLIDGGIRYSQKVRIIPYLESEDRISFIRAITKVLKNMKIVMAPVISEFGMSGRVLSGLGGDTNVTDGEIINIRALIPESMIFSDSALLDFASLGARVLDL